MVGIGEGSVGCITALDLHGPHGSMNTKGKRGGEKMRVRSLFILITALLFEYIVLRMYIIWDECGGPGKQKPPRDYKYIDT